MSHIKYESIKHVLVLECLPWGPRRKQVSSVFGSVEHSHLAPWGRPSWKTYNLHSAKWAKDKKTTNEWLYTHPWMYVSTLIREASVYSRDIFVIPSYAKSQESFWKRLQNGRKSQKQWNNKKMDLQTKQAFAHMNSECCDHTLSACESSSQANHCVEQRSGHEASPLSEELLTTASC